MNCKPGDLAIVIGDDPGCECNIGAMLVVVEPHPDAPEGYWGFEDASRPLKMLACNDDRPSWVTSSRDDSIVWAAMDDRYLVPLREPGDDAVDATLLPMDTRVTA